MASSAAPCPAMGSAPAAPLRLSRRSSVTRRSPQSPLDGRLGPRSRRPPSCRSEPALRRPPADRPSSRSTPQEYPCSSILSRRARRSRPHRVLHRRLLSRQFRSLGGPAKRQLQGRAARPARLQRRSDQDRAHPDPRRRHRREADAEAWLDPHHHARSYGRSYDLYGKPVSEGVKEIVWTGGELPDAFYDEFVFRARIAGEAAGKTLPFPASRNARTAASDGSRSRPKARMHTSSRGRPRPCGAGAARRPARTHYKAGPLTIEAPWSRATPGGAKVAGGYLRDRQCRRRARSPRRRHAPRSRRNSRSTRCRCRATSMRMRALEQRARDQARRRPSS